MGEGTRLIVREGGEGFESMVSESGCNDEHLGSTGDAAARRVTVACAERAGERDDGVRFPRGDRKIRGPRLSK